MGDAAATGEDAAENAAEGTKDGAAATGEDAAEGAEEEYTEGSDETAEEAPGEVAEEAGKANEEEEEGDKEEEVCDEGLLDMVQDCLLELGLEALNMSMKQIIAKVEASTGTDLSEWKKLIKKMIADQATLLLTHQKVDHQGHLALAKFLDKKGANMEAKDEVGI